MRNINNDSSFVYLYGEDYVRLYDCKGLYNFTIDYCASFLIYNSPRCKEFAYTLCELSTIILLDSNADVGPSFITKLEKDWGDKAGILLPLNLDNTHWVLFFADTVKNYVYYFDPLDSNNNEKADNVLQNFIFYFNKAFPKIKKHWVRKTVEYPLQKASYNCGIFVLHFIKEILNDNMLKMSAIYPNRLRKELQKDCLKFFKRVRVVHSMRTRG